MLPEAFLKFKWFCESSYIGQISRHLKTRISEHVPKCIISHISDKKDKKSVAVKHAMTKRAIAEHLVNNTCCGRNFDISKFNNMRQC